MEPTNTHNKWTNWSANVQDRFKGQDPDEIKNILKKTVFPGAILMSQLEGDFNFAQIIRTANNFNLSCVYYYGRRHYDKRAALGTYKYTDVKFLTSLDEVYQLKEKYRFVGMDNNIPERTNPLSSYNWLSNSLIVIGEENGGIHMDVKKLCDDFVEIPSLGSVRSLNAATAAGITMFDYTTKMSRK